MDQNQTVDDDLQKAIDNITNTTNGDPVFSDPIAANPQPDLSQTTPLEPSIPNFNIPPIPEEPTLPPLPEEPTPPTAPSMPDDLLPTEPVTSAVASPATESIPTAKAPAQTANLNMQQIKESALRDLVPILSHLKMNPSQKFKIYRDIFEDLRDYSILNQAYQAAKELPDETERAEALLYLVETIDKM